MRNGRKTDIEITMMEARREQVYNLRSKGASFREIARTLGTTEATAHRDFKAVMKRVIDQNTGTATEYRELDLARVDAILLRLNPMVFPSPEKPGEPVPKPSLLAIDRYLRALDHRAKLQGLYAPIKTQDVDWKVQAIEDIKAGSITYPAMARAFGDSLAQELFQLAGKAVIVGHATGLSDTGS